MTVTPADQRMYRFAPLDREGWILGLGAAQCVALGIGVVVSGALLQAHTAPSTVFVPMGVAVLFAFGAWDGRRFHEWAPVVVRRAGQRLNGSHRWFAPLRSSGCTTAEVSVTAPMPPFLSGLEVVDGGPAAWAAMTAGIGLVRDRRDKTVSASLPARGREFSLLGRSEQERMVHLWGDALAGFCTERNAVARVRVTEWAAPAGLGDHETFFERHGSAGRVEEARRAYADLLATARPAAVGHDVLVTVTVDLRRVRVTSRGEPAELAAAAQLSEELRLLSLRLEAAGLEVGPPLTVGQTADALRRRLDPTAIGRLDGRRAASLAQAAGLTSSRNCGPLATAAGWGEVRVDGSLHRTYWVAEWPRLDVPPNWLEVLLLHAGGTRCFAVHYEPVPPSRSRRHIDRDSTRLATDAEQRDRTGFRVGARLRRAQAAVLEREVELVAGYTELEFCGFLTVTAADDVALARTCAEYEQAAAQAGLEIRPLDGRHDLALPCSLPVGRGLARRRM